MASIQELKAQIDLHEAARELGLERPERDGNYRSPHHDDKNPSLSIYKNRSGEQAWKDHSQDVGGDLVDLVVYVNGGEKGDAIRWLHETFGIPMDPREKPAPRQLSKPEWIAEKCHEHTERAVEWLRDIRGISEDVARRAVKLGTVGWNTWTSDRVEPGNVGHGGEACAFIVKSFNPGRVVAVDMRFVDPDLNGGVKTQSHGDKFGTLWTSDLQRFHKAHVVYIVESSINALSIESAGIKGAAAVALRGTPNASNIDLAPLRGKFVVLVMDDDEPDEKGICPGAKATWTLHERLTAANIASIAVDWSRWREGDGYNDVNDILQEKGAEDLRSMLRDFEPWLIPGLPGNYDDMRGKSRVFLPALDSHKYWMYRAKEDFTTYIKKISTDPDTGQETKEFGDLCSFRIVGLSRVRIASATATMTGDDDNQPRTLFAASVQTPRHKATLLRRVFDDEQLHNVDQWRKFGAVFAPAPFSRMLTILERGADIGAREAVNFVGLAWREGRLSVNEGADTYFSEPEKQCPYHNLAFPSGSPTDARRVLEAYRATFKNGAAAELLLWALGGHLKALLGFWPHMQLQAGKGAGKSTLIKRLERSIAFTMFSRQSMQTEFRMLTTISSTSHPVGWEEISAGRQDIIDKAVALLQESYNYTVSRRGSDMTEYLLCAPVLLAGEDVPVKSLTGKLVRCSLDAKQHGPKIQDNLPRFPVKQWLEFLARHSRSQIIGQFEASLQWCRRGSRSTGADAGANRMETNYAALHTAWLLLAEFLELPANWGDVESMLLREMNDHIAETSGDREPWVSIMDTILSDISSHQYRQPYKIDHDDEGRLYMAMMPSQAMHHMRTETRLRAIWDGLSIKSDRVFKRQLAEAGVICNDDISFTAGRHRQTHAVALDAEKLAKFGLHIPEPDNSQPPPYGE